MLTIEELKIYLGIDGNHNDSLLADCLESSKELVEKVLRYELSNLDPMPIIVKEALKYSVAFLYTNRETADLLKLENTIAVFLSAWRKEGF